MNLMQKFEKNYLFGKVLIWKVPFRESIFFETSLFLKVSVSKSIFFENYLFRKVYFSKNVLFQLTVIIFWFNLLNNYSNDHLHLYFIQKISK